MRSPAPSASTHGETGSPRPRQQAPNRPELTVPGTPVYPVRSGERLAPWH
jgi:hypothetical protein